MFKWMRNNLGKLFMVGLLSFALMGCGVEVLVDDGGYDGYYGYDDDVSSGIYQIVDGIMGIIDYFD